MPITVAIIEDDSTYRCQLERALADDPRFLCPPGWSTAESALAEFPSRRTDVLLVDIRLPGLTGIECVRRLKDGAGETQFVMLTVDGHADQIFEAMKAGATGYLLKDASATAIGDAIADVHAGGSPMSSQIARKVLQAFAELARLAGDIALLSAREREVLELAAQGYVDKEIADRVGRTADAVRNRFQSIFTKLHVHSRKEAVARLHAAESLRRPRP